jgi:hypothetical protein
MPITADNDCIIELEPEVWDLGASMKVELVEVGGHPPTSIIHADQDFIVRATVTLTGHIRHYLCGQLGIGVGFESCGDGVETDLGKEVCLEPCGNGVYTLDVRVPAGTLRLTGRAPKKYKICVTLYGVDACDHPSIVFGSCHDLSITVAPTPKH